MSDSRTGSAPTVLRIVLGKRLKELRSAAGMSFRAAARRLDVSELTVRRMENGDHGLKIPYLEGLLHSYGVPRAEADDFIALARKANEPGWWHRYRDALPDWFSVYVSLESAASLMRSYEPHYVPGLLQTEGYARAILEVGDPNGTKEETERRVALRVKRQELLATPDAPTIWAVLDETVFRRPVADDPAVMRAQIDRLLEMSHAQNITLQVMPFSAGPHVGAFGPFHLFRFEMPELPDVVYTEGLTGANYLDERADVVAYLEALDRMCAQAATVARTRDILAALREEL